MYAQTEVEGRKVPTKIKVLSSFRVIDMILGHHHSAVVVEPGVLYTFGKNTDGQLGVGNTKPREAPMQVKEMSDKVIMVSQILNICYILHVHPAGLDFKGHIVMKHPRFNSKGNIHIYFLVGKSHGGYDTAK